MRIAYAFVYYFCGFMILLSILLGVLCIPTIRQTFFGFLRRHKIGSNQYFIAARYMVLAVVIAILIDAVYTYWSFRASLHLHAQDMVVDNFQLIQASQNDDYLILYKKYRELYLAQRNFFLTASTLVVYAIYRRFIIAFGKLVDIQVDVCGENKEKILSEQKQLLGARLKH